LTVFTIDQELGFLYPIQHTSTLGKFPRNFAIVPGGKLLLAANQNSDNIVSFWINEKDGTLTPTGRSVEVPSPVCIRFAG
jgi:6-phosphogluconolactonase